MFKFAKIAVNELLGVRTAKRGNSKKNRNFPKCSHFTALGRIWTCPKNASVKSISSCRYSYRYPLGPPEGFPQRKFGIYHDSERMCCVFSLLICAVLSFVFLFMLLSFFIFLLVPLFFPSFFVCAAGFQKLTPQYYGWLFLFLFCLSLNIVLCHSLSVFGYVFFVDRNVWFIFA